MSQPFEIPELLPDEFEYFQELAQAKAGISLSHHKWTLVQSRLRARLTELSMDSFSQYRIYLSQLNEQDPEWQKFINQLTTNKTDWFREPRQFDFLKESFVPTWKQQGRKHLTVWCAACSTGEEAYTLSMVLSEALGPGFTYEIIASDIDTLVLDHAKNGVYAWNRVAAQVPSPDLERGFIRGTGEISEWAKVRDQFRERITFKRINLNELASLSQLAQSGEKPDLIFCRNVFIYFSTAVIQNVIREFDRLSAPDATLVISQSETLQKTVSNWKLVRGSIYRKN